MNKCINFYEFMAHLYDDSKMARQAAKIIKALLEAQSPRLTDISENMPGKNSSSNYKSIQRLIKQVDMKEVLMRLYQESAEFVIGDPTEMERYKAPKTSYVGTLSDGKTAGYWLMVLSTPFRGRSLPRTTRSTKSGPSREDRRVAITRIPRPWARQATSVPIPPSPTTSSVLPLSSPKVTPLAGDLSHLNRACARW